MLQRLNGLHHGEEHPRLSAESPQLSGYRGFLDKRSFRRNIPLYQNQAALSIQRVIPVVDHLRGAVFRPVDILSQRLSIDAQAVQIQLVLQFRQQRMQPAGLIKVPHGMRTVGADPDQQRDLLAAWA